MKRLIVSLALLLAATAAWGQTAYDPTVAYANLEGRTTNLYLANADGTHVVRVASSAKGINGIDFAPGGGRIAFHDRAAGITVLSYTASNAGIKVDTVKVVAKGPAYSTPDFSSDGSRILYYAAAAAGNLYPNAPGIYVVPAAGGNSVFLHRGSDQGSFRWLRPASFGNAFAFLKLYPVNGQSIYEIWTVLLDGNDQFLSAGPLLSTANQAFNGIEDFDTARTRDALLITANYPTTIGVVEFDLVTYAITPVAGPTYKVHYSADDSRIVSTDLHYLGSKEYVTSLDLGTGLITRLTKAGNFGSVDARP